MEILIGIAVIALTAAMLLPVLACMGATRMRRLNNKFNKLD